MTPVFGLCDDYVTRSAALDPVAAGMQGLTGVFGAATDYSPDGFAARAELIAATLAALEPMSMTSAADRLAAGFLRERLEAQQAWHQLNEPLRLVRAPFGLTSSVRDSVDLLPCDGDGAWRNIAARLAAIPVMFASWRASLDAGLGRGLTAARRQAVQAAVAADHCLGSHDTLVASYGDGPLAAELAAAVAQAYQGYADTARYLREEYAPRATEVDAVGAERYAVAARLSLGADIDLKEAYDWGWAELARIEAEMTAEADAVRPGASVAEATAILNESAYVTSEDAYLAWLQDRHDRAIEQLDGVHFDIPAPLRRIEVVLARGSTSGAAYYTGPSEDLTRPGRTWWPLGGRDQAGSRPGPSCPRSSTRACPATTCRSARPRPPGTSCRGSPRPTSSAGTGKAGPCTPSASPTNWAGSPSRARGWACSADRRCAPRGWSSTSASTWTCRCPTGPGGPSTSPARCWASRAAPSRTGSRPRWCATSAGQAQAISYKLGERGWLAARAEAMRRPGFDLKRWHTAALSLGPIGLAGLADALASADPP